MRALIRRLERSPIVWPGLEDEIGDYHRYFRGNVLNAGAGNRDLSHLVDGRLYNQDIPHGIHNENIHIWSPLAKIPVEDAFFDAIICNAVLEHVEDPRAVMQEFARVAKPGAYLYLCIPFLQPEHLDPTDFQRYTKDGIQKLVRDHGFEVERVEAMHSVYHTLAWIADRWLNASSSWRYRALRWVLFPWLSHKTRTSRMRVESIASAYRVLARKPLGDA